MHGVPSGFNVFPSFIVFLLKPIQKPVQLHASQIDIISKVTDVVARSDIVNDVNMISPPDKMVPYGAGNSFAVGRSGILGEPDR